MRRYRIMMALVGAAAVWCAAPLAVTHAAQARAGGTVWGKAIEVPGLAELNAGEDAQVLSVSCGSAGNCVAGGYYTDGFQSSQGFVASERNGRWGTATLRIGRGPNVLSVSCASAGNCAAGGSYVDRSGHGQAYVASQRNGRWGTPIEVPGIGALNAGAFAQISSVSCTRLGPCAAGGNYLDRFVESQGFVVSQS